MIRTTLVLASLLLLAGASTAAGHGTACCAAKACAPEDSGCSNDGKRCISDIRENLDDSVGDQRLLPAGCVDGEAGVCIGGRVEPSGLTPEGCVGVGAGLYFSGSNTTGPISEAECTAAAVDACCAAGACK